MSEQPSGFGEKYKVSGIESDIFTRYKPEFLGRGGDHLVYQIPKHPNLVAKASWKKVFEIFKEAQSHQADDSATRSYAENRFLPDVQQKNAEIRNLRRYFGAEHTLQERRYLMQVPVPRKIMEELFRDYYRGKKPFDRLKNVQDIQDVWTTVSVQRLCKEVQDPNRLSFCFGRFPEDFPQEEAAYMNITRALLYGVRANPMPTNEFLRFQDVSPSKGLTHLIESAEHIPALKNQLIDFVQKAIAYADNEGQILDLVGKDNVIFSERDRTWNYTLVDALPLAIRPVLKDLRSYLTHPAGRSLDRRRRLHFLQVINFARAINGAASAIGIDERLYLPEISQDMLQELLHWNREENGQH